MQSRCSPHELPARNCRQDTCIALQLRLGARQLLFHNKHALAGLWCELPQVLQAELVRHYDLEVEQLELGVGVDALNPEARMQ